MQQKRAPSPDLPGHVLRLVLLLACLALWIALPARAEDSPPPVWTEWERAHSVTREKDWMVINPPGESACYMKQSYPDPERMEISLVRGGDLLVCGPFFQRQERSGAELTLRFHPGGEVLTVSQKEVSNCAVLPEGSLEGFKSGYSVSLKVVLPDREERVLEQKFSLMGFTAAHEALQSGACSQ